MGSADSDTVYGPPKAVGMPLEQMEQVCIATESNDRTANEKRTATSAGKPEPKRAKSGEELEGEAASSDTAAVASAPDAAASEEKTHGCPLACRAGTCCGGAAAGSA